MTSLAVLGLVVAGAFAVVDWLAVGRADDRIERLAKPAVMAVLIVTVLLSDPNASTRSLLLAVALAASLVGDLLLLPPERFTYGLIAFFVAHLAYLGVFLFFLGPLHLDRAAIGAVVGLAVFVVVGRSILARATAAGMRRPVGAYLAAILLMAVVATASGSLAATVGAWAFVASDAVLGWDRFAATAPRSIRDGRRRRLTVIVPYHVGQLLLTAAVLAAT